MFPVSPRNGVTTLLERMPKARIIRITVFPLDVILVLVRCISRDGGRSTVFIFPLCHKKVPVSISFSQIDTGTFFLAFT